MAICSLSLATSKLEQSSTVSLVARRPLPYPPIAFTSITGITQESKSAIECWCYAQHQHSNNSCHGTVSHGFTVSQHTHELCEVSVALRPSFARYPATSALSKGSLVPTTVGMLGSGLGEKGRLFSD